MFIHKFKQQQMTDVLKIAKIRDVKTPDRGTPHSSGIDFYIPNDFNRIKLLPNHDVVIPSGIRAQIPKGYDLVFENKGGVATKKKCIVGAKVNDMDYQGEIFIHIMNVGNESVFIDPGEKIIQGILRKVELMGIVEVEEEDLVYFSDERGTGSRGSTNK